MPDSDHVRIADVLVDPSRTLWKMCKVMLFPPVDGVILHEGKWTSINRNDAARQTRIDYFFLIKRFV